MNGTHNVSRKLSVADHATTDAPCSAKELTTPAYNEKYRLAEQAERRNPSDFNPGYNSVSATQIFTGVGKPRFINSYV
jgi:hypothetical protein